MWPMDWHFGGWGVGMMLVMVLFWALVVVGIVYLVRWVAEAGRGPARPASEETPLEILQKRYARGELNRDQYEQMRQDLESRK